MHNAAISGYKGLAKIERSKSQPFGIRLDGFVSDYANETTEPTTHDKADCLKTKTKTTNL